MNDIKHEIRLRGKLHSAQEERLAATEGTVDQAHAGIFQCPVDHIVGRAVPHIQTMFDHFGAGVWMREFQDWPIRYRFNFMQGRRLLVHVTRLACNVELNQSSDHGPGDPMKHGAL